MKHWMRTIALVAAIAGLSGCALTAEENRSGGILGEAQDKFVYNAQANLGTAHRALVITAALMKAAPINARTEGDVKQAIAQSNGLLEGIEALYYDTLYGCGAPVKDGQVLRTVGPVASYDVGVVPGFDPASVTDNFSHPCKSGYYYTNFQPDLQTLNYELFSLASVALPHAEFQKLISDARSQNYLALLTDTFSVAADAARSAGPALAVGRESTQERAYTLGGTNWPGDGSFVSASQYIDAAAEPRKAGYEPLPIYFQSLFKIATRACFDLRKTLPYDKVAIALDNNCKTTFLGQPIDLTKLGVSGVDPQVIAQTQAQGAARPAVQTSPAR